MWSLFGKQNEIKSSLYVEKSLAGLARVWDIDFLGRFSESPNGRYLFAWSDADRANGRGGYREEGLGSFLLAEYGQVILTGQAERPNDGRVANNGTFIFNDWLLGQGLRGIFYAYDINGKCIINQMFSANISNNGLSQNGEYAVCQLLSSDTEDANVLAFYDLKEEKLLWRKIPETDAGIEYKFDIENRVLSLLCRNELVFNYDFEGNLLDVAKWEQIAFERANGFQLHLQARTKLEQALEKGKSSEFQNILDLLSIALTRGIDNYPNEKASILRCMGEVQELMNNTSEAIRCYELALDLNPKVGLKRKLASMKGLD